VKVGLEVSICWGYLATFGGCILYTESITLVQTWLYCNSFVWGHVAFFSPTMFLELFCCIALSVLLHGWFSFPGDSLSWLCKNERDNYELCHMSTGWLIDRGFLSANKGFLARICQFWELPSRFHGFSLCHESGTEPWQRKGWTLKRLIRYQQCGKP